MSMALTNNQETLARLILEKVQAITNLNFKFFIPNTFALFESDYQ